MFGGAVLGATVWLAFRQLIRTPGLFLCIVISAWVCIGLFGLVRGEITLAGRGGKSPKTFSGVWARLTSVVIILLAAAFTAVIVSIDG